MIFYAKSNGETLEEHIKKCLDAFKKLKDLIKVNEDESNIIEKLIHYHDQGKKNPLFQNNMRKLLKINENFKWNNSYIPHEWLSPAFITQEEENNIKSNLKKIGLKEEKYFHFFIFVLLAHHYREIQLPNENNIKDILEWIKNNFNEPVDYYYNIQQLLSIYNNSEEKELWNLFFPYRIKWLGTLIKCDYAASAGIEAETDYKGDYKNDFNKFFKDNNFKLKKFQEEVGKKDDKNIILVASTGMGKTEAAMNWINGQKAFYLLGIRIAVNEMYKRFKTIFGDNVTLLHGETSYFFAQNETDENEYELKIEKARKLSYPMTIATADQLITSVFKYPGFELTYLTCSYSKIVLDEIQSFSPTAIAAIVVFLKEIYKLGGKFMLMTATLPPFLLDEFKEFKKDIYIFEPELLDIKRHKISIIDNKIEIEETKKLINKNKDKKILIICNTIRKAQQMFNFLEKFNPNLIHSQFINKDKKNKEEQIMNVVNPCIWISTQVVEASLDIDFDLLLTENASIESLLQRFGRCYRKREYTEKTANIYIFKSQPYNIYDKYLFKKTWKVIKSYNDKYISELDKQEMIKNIFENIENTKYYSEYKNQKNLLEIGYRSLSKIEAQQDFRQITNNYIIIPEGVFNENKQQIREIIDFIENKNNDKLERLKKQAELFDYTISIQLYDKNINCLEEIPNSQFCKKHRIMILKGYEYSTQVGLICKTKGKEENDNII